MNLLDADIDAPLSTSILIPLDVPIEELEAEIKAMYLANKAIDRVVQKITSSEFLHSDEVFYTDDLIDELAQYGFVVDEFIDVASDNIEQVTNEQINIFTPTGREISLYGG